MKQIKAVDLSPQSAETANKKGKQPKIETEAQVMVHGVLNSLYSVLIHKDFKVQCLKRHIQFLDSESSNNIAPMYNELFCLKVQLTVTGGEGCV